MSEIHICPKCGHTEWYCKGDQLCYECKKCHYRTSLRKNIVMENSKFPLRYWFITIIPDTKAGTVNAVARRTVKADISVRSDGTTFHTDFPSMFKEYMGRVIGKADIEKVLL